MVKNKNLIKAEALFVECERCEEYEGLEEKLFNIYKDNIICPHCGGREIIHNAECTEIDTDYWWAVFRGLECKECGGRFCVEINFPFEGDYIHSKV